MNLEFKIWNLEKLLKDMRHCYLSVVNYIFAWSKSFKSNFDDSIKFGCLYTEFYMMSCEKFCTLVRFETYISSGRLDPIVLHFSVRSLHAGRTNCPPPTIGAIRILGGAENARQLLRRGPIVKMFCLL